MKPVALTPGELLLLQQMRMVARLQGWDFPKLVKKVGKLNSLLQGALAQDQAPAPTDPAVTQAEALLKEIQDMMKPDPSPEPPPV